METEAETETEISIEHFRLTSTLPSLSLGLSVCLSVYLRLATVRGLQATVIKPFLVLPPALWLRLFTWHSDLAGRPALPLPLSLGKVFLANTL